ncbi:hypothetical protein KUV61_17030 [Nocardioides marinus]|nr:hypothetical protein [Nocardioides marinus]
MIALRSEYLEKDEARGGVFIFPQILKKPTPAAGVGAAGRAGIQLIRQPVLP